MKSWGLWTMSSGSNLSWCTAKESIQFLKTEDDHRIPFENIEAQVATDQMLSLSKHQKTRVCCCEKPKNECKVPAWKIPWIILIISATQIATYFVACNDSVSILIFKPHYKYEIWRYFTYHLIHFSLTHLALNMFLQIIIALPLESEQGHFRVLFVYFSSIVFGAFGSLYFDSTKALMGSSAGVYGLLSSHVSHCILNWTNIQKRNIRLASIFLLITFDVSFIMLKCIYWHDMEPKVSVSSHTFGFVGGLIMGFVIYNKLNSVCDIHVQIY